MRKFQIVRNLVDHLIQHRDFKTLLYNESIISLQQKRFKTEKIPTSTFRHKKNTWETPTWPPYQGGIFFNNSEPTPPTGIRHTRFSLTPPWLLPQLETRDDSTACQEQCTPRAEIKWLLPLSGLNYQDRILPNKHHAASTPL